jgi:hypothetical protein
MRRPVLKGHGFSHAWIDDKALVLNGHDFNRLRKNSFGR